jgi:hypothetical protein
MANELIVKSTSGQTVYAVARIAIRTNASQWANVTDGTKEAFTAANWEKYAITLTELGTIGLYEGDVPSFLADERALDILFYIQSTNKPALGDSIVSGALYEFMDEWVPSVSLDV